MLRLRCRLLAGPDASREPLRGGITVSEASTHWGSVLEGLQARGLRAPKLVISDAHKGLTKALEKWPGCLCLLFIHPRAPNLISLRSAGTMPA